jgi:hypothetical protein
MALGWVMKSSFSEMKAHSLQLIINFALNFFLIAVRLLPAFYYLTLILSAVAIIFTEALFDIYAITFRPFVYSLLMFVVLQVLTHKSLNWFNKYFWYGVKGIDPARTIYLWLRVIVGVFGIACLTSGLTTVFIGPDSQFSMFNIRDNIFFPAVAAFLISPIFITLHLHLKGGQGFAKKTKHNAV